jgi:hypothetical protein
MDLKLVLLERIALAMNKIVPRKIFENGYFQIYKFCADRKYYPYTRISFSCSVVLKKK